MYIFRRASFLGIIGVSSLYYRAKRESKENRGYGITQRICRWEQLWQFANKPSILPTVKATSIPETLHEIPMPNRPPVQLLLRPHKHENIEKFATSGTLSEDWSSGSVWDLNGEKFRQLATKPSRHIFVMFYTAGCTHCEKMKSIWESVGEHFANRSDVVIAKVNLNENSLLNESEVKVPMFVLYPKGNIGGGYKYAGQKSVEGFTNFVETKGQITVLSEKMVAKLQKKIEEKENNA
ncbi:DgyrCDS7908 [Dimorphilus gyrociliatus]|uniref:DgyrCDS7908 n=1 Tax=Dimorphilus gyrociliatus TaxID=2664684 RepID=A0A7I8VSL1_9ANNE|nr:DgyrCDS7908 [Dimorphilus gyrociliatus]